MEKRKETTQDEITVAVDELIKSIRDILPDEPDKVDRISKSLGDLIAIVIGRSTVMAAKAVTAVYGELESDLKKMEFSNKAIRMNSDELSRRFDAVTDKIYREMDYLAEQIMPIDTIYRIAVKVEELERKVGDES